MTKTLDPFYSTGVKNVYGKATAAKTTMSDATNAVLLYTAPSEGAIVNRCTVRALGTFTDTLAYLFTSPDAVNLHLKGAVKLTGATVNTTTLTPTGDFGAAGGWDNDKPLVLTGGEKLYGAISVALVAGFEFEADVEEFN